MWHCSVFTSLEFIIHSVKQYIYILHYNRVLFKQIRAWENLNHRTEIKRKERKQNTQTKRRYWKVADLKRWDSITKKTTIYRFHKKKKKKRRRLWTNFFSLLPMPLCVLFSQADLHLSRNDRHSIQIFNHHHQHNQKKRFLLPFRRFTFVMHASLFGSFVFCRYGVSLKYKIKTTTSSILCFQFFCVLEFTALCRLNKRQCVANNCVYVCVCVISC